MRIRAIKMRQPMRTAALVTLACVASSAFSGDRDRHDGDDRDNHNSSYDPAYNVCRGTDPRCYHDWAHEERIGNQVLIYTRTAGPRHANLGPRLAAGLDPPLAAGNVVQNALKSWLEQEGVEVHWTEDVTRLTSLHRYKAVIFASTSRDTLFAHGRAIDPALALNTATGAHLDAARTALRQYIRAGGGFVGIHNAFGTEYNWPWYEGLLGNANYYDHGANQDGMINIVSRNDSSTDGLPKVWPFRDEWYNLEPFPTRVKFLATVDENTLATRREIHPGHGDFHPIAWCQYYDGGRSWVTTIGHDGAAFTDGSGFPGQPQFKQLIVNGIKSAMGLVPFCTGRGHGRD
jgi:uncharacterized protein